MHPLIPTTPPQEIRCEVSGRRLRKTCDGLCRTCRGQQDTHRQRADPWARVLR